jgi:hypothetical protein
MRDEAQFVDGGIDSDENARQLCRASTSGLDLLCNLQNLRS